MARSDVLVLGATGYTGRLICHRLTTHRLKWAIGGRSQPRLTALAEECRSMSTDSSAPSVVIADVNDLASLQAAVASTVVCINCIGPYELLKGLDVAAACIVAKTHYLDLTGEPAFFNAMVKRLDAGARAAGVCLIPGCAFDSAPSDLLGWRTRIAAGARIPSHVGSADMTLEIAVSPSSYPTSFAQWRQMPKSEGPSMSHGSLYTAVFGARATILAALGIATRPINRNPIRSHVVEQAGLSGTGLPAPPFTRRLTKAHRLHKNPRMWGAWMLPWPTSDALVVARSHALTEAGRSAPVLPADVRVETAQYFNGGSLFGAMLALMGALVLTIASLVPFGSGWIRGKMATGEGPSDPGSGRMSLVALGKVYPRGEKNAIVTVMMEANAAGGYLTSSVVAAEGAVAVLEKARRGKLGSGVMTPATAVGDELMERVEEDVLAIRERK